MANGGLFPGFRAGAVIGENKLQSLIREIPITSSVLWTAPCNGIVNIWVCGAAGSGGMVLNTATSNYTKVALGGAGSGFSLIRRKVRKGQKIQFTLGAGGAAVSSTGANQSTPGNNGGNTSVVSDDFSINITGGQGGPVQSIVNTSAIQLTAPAAGTASGGDINFNGGTSGVNTFGTTAGCGATGGGSCGYIGGDGRNSGNVTGANSVTGGSSIRFASLDNNASGTGVGAGVGSTGVATVSAGGPLMYPSLVSTTNAQGYKNSSAALTTFSAINGLSYIDFTYGTMNPFRGLVDGAAMLANNNATEITSGSGSGGSGVYMSTAGVMIAGNGGSCAGGGGLVLLLSAGAVSSTGSHAGDGGIGAGGGGLAAYSALSGYAKSGKGGDAFAFIELEILND